MSAVCRNVGDVLRRRNSVVRVVRVCEKLAIEKTYHARYTARQEYEAYLSLDPLLAVTPGVRRPLVYDVDDGRNAIRIEYVDGIDLRESFRRDGIGVLQRDLEILVHLFATSRSMDVRLDSDPANFIAVKGNQGLVIVDPVTADIDLADFSAVVFLFGLIKTFFYSRRWYAAGVFAQCWKRYYTAYVDAVGIGSEELNRQMVRYIDAVIDWNRNESAGDGVAKRAGRLFFMVPIWRAIQLFFRWNLVGRTQSSGVS